MMFRKRRRPLPPQVASPAESRLMVAAPELYFVHFDMMLKGAKIRRGREMVRQFAVVAGGKVRLVTSGETVEREVFEALVAAGAVAPPQAPGAAEDTAGALHDDASADDGSS